MASSEDEAAANQEFVDAVLLTTEREARNGAPWCREADATALKKALTARGIALGGLLRQMVRLVRLVDAASGHGYIGFLYMDLHSLEARHVRHRLGEAFAHGKLARIARAEDSGVTFLEPEMAAASGSFSLDYAQMPRLLALLDIVHNMLGFPAVERLVSGLRGPTSVRAEAVAEAVEDALLAWLAPRLQSLHHQRAAHAMRDYLMPRDRHDPDGIDDDTILAFWRDEGSQPEAADGFRLFVFAARRLLSYRAALATSAAERGMANAKPLDGGSFGGNSFDEELPEGLADKAGDSDETDLAQVHLVTEDWVSPLKELFSPPAGKVKWLVGTDRKFLAQVFEDAAPDSPPGAGGEVLDDGDEGSAQGGLFEDRRPDVSFAGTILRAQHFGAVQHQWKSGKRPASSAEDSYARVSARYRDIADALGDAGAAASLGLLASGQEAGLSLLTDIAPDLLPAIVPRLSGENEDVAVVALRGLGDLSATARVVSNELAPRTSKTGAALRRAAAKAERAGLREGDRGDKEIVEALSAGAGPLVSLRREVAGLAVRLDAAATGERFAADREIFHARFADMYQTA